MKILCFDLSLTCTGVAFADVDDNGAVNKMLTVSIIPDADEASAIKKLGLLRKREIKTKSGGGYRAYVTTTDEKPTYAEKKKRDVMVRNTVNMEKRASLAEQIKRLIDGTDPELILVERNESFNGILTTKLLAEARGILEGAGVGIEIKQYSVAEIRKGIDLITLTREFVNEVADKGVAFPKDITKSALKRYVEKKYNIVCNNTDESDACMILDCYLRNKEEK